MAQGTTKGVPIDTDNTLAADSDILVPSQKAIKAYITNLTFNATKIANGSVSNTEFQYLDGVTSAIQTQIDLKAPIESPTFTGTVGGITKSMVGLGNVDNTSDANKPISTATQTALDAKQATLTNPVTGTGTNNQIAAFNSTGSTITSLSTSTYPSLTELSYGKGVTSAIQTQLDNAPTVLYRLPSAVNIGNSVTTVVTTITTFDITGLSVGTTFVADALFSSTSNANQKIYQISLSGASSHQTIVQTTGGSRGQLLMRVQGSNTIRMSLVAGVGVNVAINPSFVDVTGSSNVFTLQIRCTVNGTGGGVPVNTVESLTLTRF